MPSSDVIRKVIDLYGPHFHIYPPAGSRPFYIEESTEITSLNPPEVNTNFQLCQGRLHTRDVLVLHQYGVVVSNRVPSPDFPGFTYVPIDPLAFKGKLAWKVIVGGSDEFSSHSYQADGSKIGGVGSFRYLTVGRGQQPLIIEARAKYLINLRVINPAQGADYSPDGTKFNALLSGFILSVPG